MRAYVTSTLPVNSYQSGMQWEAMAATQCQQNTLLYRTGLTLSVPWLLVPLPDLLLPNWYSYWYGRLPCDRMRAL